MGCPPREAIRDGRELPVNDGYPLLARESIGWSAGWLAGSVGVVVEKGPCRRTRLVVGVAVEARSAK